MLIYLLYFYYHIISYHIDTFFFFQICYLFDKHCLFLFLNISLSIFLFCLFVYLFVYLLTFVSSFLCRSRLQSPSTYLIIWTKPPTRFFSSVIGVVILVVVVVVVIVALYIIELLHVFVCLLKKFFSLFFI